MIALGRKRTNRRHSPVAPFALLAIFLMGGCALPGTGSYGGTTADTGGGSEYPDGGRDFPCGGADFPCGGPGFPGGPTSPGGGTRNAKAVCFCDVAEAATCCRECPQAPVCQAKERQPENR